MAEYFKEFWLEINNLALKGGVLNPSLRIKTEEEALAAVEEDGHALEFLPPELQTEEICTATVEQC